MIFFVFVLFLKNVVGVENKIVWLIDFVEVFLIDWSFVIM